MARRVLPNISALEPIDETSENQVNRRGSSEQLRGDEGFSGPLRDRNCTDLPCLLAFVVLTLGLIAAAVFSKR